MEILLDLPAREKEWIDPDRSAAVPSRSSREIKRGISVSEALNFPTAAAGDSRAPRLLAAVFLVVGRGRTQNRHPMDQPTQVCPKCGAPRPSDQSLPRCLNCGADFDLATNRRTLWRLFWLLFLGTPFLSVGALLLTQGSFRFVQTAVPALHFAPRFGAPAILLVGAFGAGYFLAKTHTHSQATAIIGAILYGIGILIVYGSIVFAGCLLIMKGIR